MGYQALYRKHRPQRFESVAGQHHVTTILKNQIQSGHTSHAYLFCGSRGTGKTSTAKIFARAVNCLAPVDGEACGVCTACLAMAENDVDIIEIDAASNNGVDDMRELIEQARFTPLMLRYKIYIIDEVHMLSNSASNALLKTLEEPPGHVKFLLATTEPQKLLPTVISRCQRFDFRRLAVKEIISVLRGALQDAGMQMEEGGLYAIAQAADGGMRDALSLLDQCMAFAGENMREQDVYDVLGGMSSAFLFTLIDALIAADARKAISMLDEYVQGGRDTSVFLQDLAKHFRALLLVQVCGENSDILTCTPETMALYAAQAAQCSEARLLRALGLVARAQSDLKWLPQPRVFIEAMLVRICRPEDELNLLALEERVSQLEQAQATPRQPQAGPLPPVTAAASAADAPPWEQKPDTTAWDQKPDTEVISEAETPVPDASSEVVTPPVTAATPQPDAPQQEYSEEDLQETPQWTAVWASLRKSIQRSHAALYVLTAGAVRIAGDGQILQVNFPPAKAEQVRTLQQPQKLQELQKALDAASPGLHLQLRMEGSKQSLNDLESQAEELRRVFGDKLSIEES